MDILKRIEQLRLERNWSIYRLSVKSGVPQSTLVNMFSRKTLPSIITLELLCNAFGITLAEFFTSPAEKGSDIFSETELLSTYKALPDRMKRAICDIMREYNNKS